MNSRRASSNGGNEAGGSVVWHNWKRQSPYSCPLMLVQRKPGKAWATGWEPDTGRWRKEGIDVSTVPGGNN